MMKPQTIVLVIGRGETHKPVPSAPRVPAPPPKIQDSGMSPGGVVFCIGLTAIVFFLLGLGSSWAPRGDTVLPAGSLGPYVQ